MNLIADENVDKLIVDTLRQGGYNVLSGIDLWRENIKK